MKLKKISLNKVITIAIMLLTALFLLLRFDYARSLLFMFSAVALNLILTSYKRIIRLPIEIEVLSFAIVMTGYTMGLTAGILIALLGGIAYIVFSSQFNPFSIPMLFGYVLMAMIASIFHRQPIVMVGIAANLIHNLFVFLVYHYFFRYDPLKNLIYGGSNILFNMFLFVNFSSLILDFL